jgi:hypothetical protein
MTIMDQDRPRTDADIRALAARVVGDAPETPFGVYLFAADEHASALGRYVEEQVFAEAFGNSAELLEREYGAYEAATAFLVVIDHRRLLPAGAMRLITPSAAGFKTLDEIGAVWQQPLDEVLLHTALTLPPDRVWDVATLAVAPDYRGKATAGLVSMALYRGLCRGADVCGVDWWVTILDSVVLRMLQWQLHKPFTTFQRVAPMPYLGSGASVPVWSNINAWRQRLADEDGPTYELLFADSELDAAISGPDPASFERYVARAGHLLRAPAPGPA